MSARNKEVDWVMFKKYFQRIYKHADYKYKGWDVFSPGYIENSTDPVEVYILGHSLDVTDKDVLNDLILNGKQTKTAIFIEIIYNLQAKSEI